ncbi:MAG: molybdenum ABC transporter ATP-binding protein [Magnetococcales bacterium]|nr:molybdenum ABC transporter ATP-binding protein [Magnetococcales bacterium]
MTPPTQTIHLRSQLAHPGFALDIDLDIPGRGVTALFGPSGSGKTTVLRIVAGLERSSSGFLCVNGTVWQDAARGFFLPTHRRPIGYVFQESSLFVHLDVYHNLAYGMQRVPQAKRHVSLEDAIALLGIEHLLTRKPATLSGGERQRVAIARALAVSPTILLLDEPLASLDLTRKQEILPYLERLHRELAIPILYVSHDPDEVARLADHLVVLQKGRVLANGPLHETLARIDLPIPLGEETGVVLNAVVGIHDAAWHLFRADFAGGSLWVREHDLPLRQTIRVRILARDVSLALEQPHHTSILNQFPGQVMAIAQDAHPGLALVRVQVGDSPIVARVTQRSAAALGLTPGQSVWVQVKSVALME